MGVSATNSISQTMIENMEDNSCTCMNNQLTRCRGRLEVIKLFVPENYLTEHQPKNGCIGSSGRSF